jgi:hypothetical protein
MSSNRRDHRDRRVIDRSDGTMAPGGGAHRALTEAQLAETHRLRRDVTALIEAHQPPLLPLDEFEREVLRIDQELARFLRSRVWKYEEARDGVVGWLVWRREYRPTHIRPSDCDEAISRSGAFFFHGYDVLGQPLCYLNVSLIDPSEGDIERRQRYIIFQMERAKRMIKLDGSAGRCAAVFDLSGAGLGNLDRPLLMFLLTAVKRYYPDSFGRVYLVNMPYAFRFVWSWVKPMLALHAQEKVRFIDEEGGLSEFVERRWLLQKYGGDGVYDPAAAADADEQLAQLKQPEPEPEPEPEPALKAAGGAQARDDDVFYDALPGPVRKEAELLRSAVDDVRSSVQNLLDAVDRLEARRGFAGGTGAELAAEKAAARQNGGGGALGWLAQVLCNRWTWVGIAVAAITLGVRRRRLLLPRR